MTGARLLTFFRQIYQIAQGLAFLHENDIVHGNLTVDSIVIVKGKAQITGLQYACVDNEDNDADKEFDHIYQGNRRHNLIAPEINYPDSCGRKSSRPRKPSDIYSLAMIACSVRTINVSYVLTWRADFLKLRQIYMTMPVWLKDLQCIKIGFHPKSTTHGTRPGKPYSMGDSEFAIIRTWWDENTERRPSAQQAVEAWRRSGSKLTPL